MIDMIKQVYDDKVAEINGNSYYFTNCSHQKRLRIFGYSTKIKDDLANENFSFLSTDEWRSIEKDILSTILFDNEVLSKKANHFEQDKYISDYLILITTALAVISYPFIQGNI